MSVVSATQLNLDLCSGDDKLKTRGICREKPEEIAIDLRYATFRPDFVNQLQKAREFLLSIFLFCSLYNQFMIVSRTRSRMK